MLSETVATLLIGEGARLCFLWIFFACLGTFVESSNAGGHPTVKFIVVAVVGTEMLKLRAFGSPLSFSDAILPILKSELPFSAASRADRWWWQEERARQANEDKQTRRVQIMRKNATT